MSARNKKLIISVIAIAIAIKLFLFAFTAVSSPQGKFLPDSYGYLKLAEMISSKGIFALQNEAGTINYELFRTPGYPLFLAIINNILKVPLSGVIFIQILITIAVAYIIYKTAYRINPEIALLAMIIILFDPPVTVYSLTILTESLYLLFISLFMYNFTSYLKHKRTGSLALSALIIALATYVRPIGYYLGFAISFFIIYANKGALFRNGLKHAVVFLIITYSLIGLWQVRNYAKCHTTVFCSVEGGNLKYLGLYKSYARNTDPYTKGMAPVPYYINVSSRCLISLMTRPGNFKYFGNDTLTVTGKIFGYPWMAFWLTGLVMGAVNAKKDGCMQFMLFVIIYFIAASVGGLMWGVGERFRVPIMPFIAIISAYGWKGIGDWLTSCQKSRIG